jgi:3',5'-cyclic AMP phosphodiesterase CpdA
MNTLTIAHLSDLHINHRYFPERSALLRETLRECNDRNIEHLIITGDISHLGRGEELEQCGEILREHGYWDSSTLTVTIGNHDIFGGPYFAEDVLTFPGICRETAFDEKVRRFTDVFAQSFESSIHGDGESFFPFVKLVGDMALIGINTIARWSALKNPLGSNGEVDDMQFKRLERVFNDSRLQGRRLIVLTHHHFHTPKYLKTCSVLGNAWQRVEGHTLKLRGRKRLLELFKLHGVEKILHGHVHEHTEYRQGGVTCLNAGASMLPAGGNERNYHIIGGEAPGREQRQLEPRRAGQHRPPTAHVRMPQYIFST